ncbi:hypothetical protein QL996_08335 [Planococcus sp. APC 4015]|nr:hypothetical protein [Planococcus sp. APC 4015]
MLDGETQAELERLRRRAFGPHADIDTDPPAIARLQELESAARDASRGGPAADEADRAVVSDEPDADPAGPADSPPDPTTDFPRVTRLAHVRAWLRSPVAWALSVIAAVVVTAVVTLAAVAGQPPVARLGPSDGDVPRAAADFLRGDVVVYEEFEGMSIFSGVRIGQPDFTCLILIDAERVDNLAGLACAPSEFSVSADLVVGSGSSAATRDRFEIGTPLRFTLVPEGVVVHAGDAEQMATGPTSANQPAARPPAPPVWDDSLDGRRDDARTPDAARAGLRARSRHHR